MQIGKRTRRERETPRRIAFQPKNKKDRERKQVTGRKPYVHPDKRKKPVYIDRRVLALEMGLDHYMFNGRFIELYCPDCGDLLEYKTLAGFSRQCKNEDCHFIGYKKGVPIREAVWYFNRSEFMKKVWARPGYRENQSEITKERWKTPEFRERAIEGGKKRWEEPEFRERNTKMLKKRGQDPGFRKKRSEIMIELWKDPEWRKKTMRGQRIERASRIARASK